MRLYPSYRLAGWVMGFSLAASSLGAQQAIGVFDRHGDVGRVTRAGSVTFDADGQYYVLAGSNENM